MDEKAKEQRAARIAANIAKLGDRQLASIESVTDELGKPYIEAYVLPASDLINQCILETLGDAIRLHHCFSKGPFTKDKFEYALEAAVNSCGGKSTLAPSGNPGYDITINGVPFSLKTEAEATIRPDLIHISKAMELGKGEWDLSTLRAQFLSHLTRYDRILTLRRLSKIPDQEYYELVEIPKTLLLESEHGTLRIMENSRQNPKPGYCDVLEDGQLKFQLYFDGGSERKLQIRKIRKSNCAVQAYWKFYKPPQPLPGA